MFYQQAQKNIVIMKGKKDICETLMQPSFGHKFQDVQGFIMGSIVQMKLTF